MVKRTLIALMPMDKLRLGGTNIMLYDEWNDDVLCSKDYRLNPALWRLAKIMVH